MPTLAPPETDPARIEVPKVLVLMATLNGALWLGEQLDSIFAQRGVSVSLLVADDGSSDQTVEMLLERSASNHSIQILEKDDCRLGPAGNFFRLLRRTPRDGFDYVALSDQDDVWLPRRLCTAVEQLSSQAAAGYSSEVTAFWADGRRRVLGKAQPQRAHDHFFEPAGPGCTYVLTAALAGALAEELRNNPQRFTDIGYHDWLIYAFARTHGFRWFIDPTPSLLYRQHEQNELGANFGFAGVRRRWKRITSGWFRCQVVTILELWPGNHHDLACRVRRFNWHDRVWLAVHASSMRRNRRDQLALAVMALLAVLR